MTDLKELALRVAKEEFEQAGHSHPYEVSWTGLQDFATRFLAAYLAEQKPVATLHDDGYWTLTKNAPSDIGPKSQHAGWRMDVYAAPQLPKPAPAGGDAGRGSRLCTGSARCSGGRLGDGLVTANAELRGGPAASSPERPA